MSIRSLKALCLLLAAFVGRGNAQTLQTSVDTARITVGDAVAIHLRGTVPAGGELVDRLPRSGATLPAGVRLLGADSLHVQQGGMLTSVVRMGFYRTGTQRVPPFVIGWRSRPGGASDSLVSQPIAVTVTSVLPEVNHVMRDIKEVRYSALPLRRIEVVAVAVLALVALGVWMVRRQRARARAAAAARARAAAVAPPPTAYEEACARLAEVAARGLAARGEVDRHYELVTDVLRRYLEEAHDVPALERTSAELLWSLPPRLAEPSLRAAHAALFEQADLVKFAKVRPVESRAVLYVAQARLLLDRWQALSEQPQSELAGVASGEGDAIR
jgi:hypothetical protein